jgi:cohesin complex subunit SA-1/2
MLTLSNLAQQQETEYPLISKARTTRSFRDLLVGFFQSLIGLLHESEQLYKDNDLMKTIREWLVPMSSSALRPFRHTATTISLSITSGLVEVADTLDNRITNIEQQLQASKRSKNKTRTAEIQKSLKEANEHREKCAEWIDKDFFNGVFVHRYRDTDPKIRAECVEALGNWIHELPTVFMEPSYLRYLGWMLSDTNGVTRSEVLKQLARILKRNAEQLGHFIDRFRPRLVEMATRDAEVSVRVAAINVIDTLRAAAQLEPTEIDAIGELIFDNEIRIRKAVVGFFVACVNDVYEGKVGELGGTDVLDEFDNVDEDDFESPRKEWADIKCLAETLAIYDAQIEERQQQAGAFGLDVAVDLSGSAAPETRISLASQVLYEKVSVIKEWQQLAGYLLYDHTTSTNTKAKSRSKSNSPEAAFKKAVAPTTAEEAILLKVLASAVKSSIAQIADLDKGKRRGQRLDAPEANEELAIELANIIPKLLNKFGAEPETATTVLRLEHYLNLGIFQQLRQDSNTYGKLLDEVCTQFTRHNDNSVISEAAVALLHARQFEELEELADDKLSVLWENNISALRTIDKTCELSVRGNLTADSLKSLSTVLLKISKLAAISDCVDILDAEGASDDAASASLAILINIVHRGKYEPQEEEIDDLEDEVVTYAIKTCQFYFMWRVRTLSKILTDGTSMSAVDVDRLSVLRQTYRRYLIETFSSRAAIDELRLFATGSLCDLHLTFATLRGPLERSTSQSTVDSLKGLLQDIETGLVPELIQIFDGAEKQYAKKAKKDKTLNPPGDDEDPMDDDPAEDDAEDEEEDGDENLTPEERLAAELKAEKALCELTAKLVLAISAKILDNRGADAGKLRRRLQRNQTKLGNNFKEVVTYLDEAKILRRAASGSKKPANKTAQAERPVLSKETVHVGSDDESGGENDGADLFDDPIEDEDAEEEAAAAAQDKDSVIDDEDDEEEGRRKTTNDLDDDILGD